MICDLDQVAAYFNVTEKAVRGWVAAGMPVQSLGTRGGARKKTTIALVDAVIWYFSQNHERLELDRARTRLASEQAEKARMENDLRRADLAEVSVIAMVIDDLVANARTNLLALPRKIAPELEGLNVQQREEAIEHPIKQCLEDLSSYRPKRPVGLDRRKDHAGPPKAPAKSHRKRVGRRKQGLKSRGKRRAGKVEDGAG